MFYCTHTPAPPLRAFIERFWLCSDAPSHRTERILPSGTLELVVNLREDEIRIYDPVQPDRVRRLSGAVVSGTYGSFFLVDTLQHAAILGVHFRPGGAFPFLGMPIGEMADTHVDLATLWGRAPAAELRERLCAAATPAARFRLLEAILAARLRHPSRHHALVSEALGVFSRNQMSVRGVAQHVGLSQRRFIQVFAAEVGLTPKLYCRVQRFQQARQMVGRAAAPDWAGVAVACGYFDQSHLIRDFREFSGLNPSAYLRQASEHVLPNHVPQAG